ncbi:MAG: hypothetical protein V5A24_08280 [Haloarculaceae archaeon]
MDAALVVAGGNATMVDRAREFLEGVTTWEGRVAVSVAMVLLTLLVAIVLAPRLLRGFGRSLLGRFAGERAARSAELLGDAVPTTLGDVRLGSVQPGLVIVGASPCSLSGESSKSPGTLCSFRGSRSRSSPTSP